MTPIIVSGDEATKLIDAQVKGKRYEPKQINSLPSQFTKWIDRNGDRINIANNRGTLPYWIKDNPKFARITTAKETVIQGMDKSDKSKDVKDLRDWAKRNIAKKTIYHNELGKDIIFTVNGIKEYLNQPHSHYIEKNQLIKDIQNIIRDSTYKGFTNYKGRISHVFEIEIKGDKSWIIANEHKGRGIILYSISDNEKVLTDIKK
jgi:hypothetical protein